MLHRLAGVRTDQRARLVNGLRLVMASAMLTDDEVEELLGRFDRSGADAAAVAVDADSHAPA